MKSGMSFRNAFMSNSSGGSIKLNFEPDEFHSENFSVDEFIQRKRQVVPLDVLRDDLGYHLKCLRSSLIELINQDYGQFVNLSSNLVGLDGRIQAIVGPLKRTRNDLQAYDELLCTNISSLSDELEKRRKIREDKAQLQFHRMAAIALDSSEKYIKKVPNEIVTSIDFNLLRNTCDEVAETKFLLQRCSKSLINQQMQLRWDVLCNSVLKRLNSLLKIYAEMNSNTLNTVESSSESISMTQSLMYMYTELQCESVVEEVIIRDILKPKFEAVLSRKGNIIALFEAVEFFLLQSPVIKVWKNLNEYPWMSKYDFITRGVFPCITGILSKHFPHIWSPSNPESFHSNWTRCDAFIVALEKAMPSLDHLQKFRCSDAIKDFISKWQFPVYFQLRFHGLAIELESALETFTEPCATSDFKLDATRVMVKVLNQCWEKEKVFIAHISGRFLKASALIVSRYIKEIQKEVASNKNCPINTSINMYCDLNLAELVVRQILIEEMHKELNLNVPQLSSAADIIIDPSDSKTTMQFLSDFQWDDARGAIETHLVEITVSQSSLNISAVNEVPRLYRRTNREVPTKQLEYVDAILLPISSLKNDVNNAHQGELWNKLGCRIGNQILQRYKVQVQEVLVSVQRMEESLKRLKKVKGQTQTTSGDNSKVLSDDDKIRLQIQIDVNYFTLKIKGICSTVDTSSIGSLFESINGKS